MKKYVYTQADLELIKEEILSNLDVTGQFLPIYMEMVKKYGMNLVQAFRLDSIIYDSVEKINFLEKEIEDSILYFAKNHFENMDIIGEIFELGECIYWDLFDDDQIIESIEKQNLLLFFITGIEDDNEIICIKHPKLDGTSALKLEKMVKKYKSNLIFLDFKP